MLFLRSSWLDQGFQGPMCRGVEMPRTSLGRIASKPGRGYRRLQIAIALCAFSMTYVPLILGYYHTRHVVSHLTCPCFGSRSHPVYFILELSSPQSPFRIVHFHRSNLISGTRRNIRLIPTPSPTGGPLARQPLPRIISRPARMQRRRRSDPAAGDHAIGHGRGGVVWRRRGRRRFIW